MASPLVTATAQPAAQQTTNQHMQAKSPLAQQQRQQRQAAATIVGLAAAGTLLLSPLQAQAVDAAAVFSRSCAGCHAGGGNVIRSASTCEWVSHALRCCLPAACVACLSSGTMSDRLRAARMGMGCLAVLDWHGRPARHGKRCKLSPAAPPSSQPGCFARDAALQACRVSSQALYQAQLAHMLQLWTCTLHARLSRTKLAPRGAWLTRPTRPPLQAGRHPAAGRPAEEWPGWRRSALQHHLQRQEQHAWVRGGLCLFCCCREGRSALCSVAVVSLVDACGASGNIFGLGAAVKAVRPQSPACNPPTLH